MTPKYFLKIFHLYWKAVYVPELHLAVTVVQTVHCYAGWSTYWAMACIARCCDYYCTSLIKLN